MDKITLDVDISVSPIFAEATGIGFDHAAREVRERLRSVGFSQKPGFEHISGRKSILCEIAKLQMFCDSSHGMRQQITRKFSQKGHALYIAAPKTRALDGEAQQEVDA